MISLAERKQIAELIFAIKDEAVLQKVKALVLSKAKSAQKEYIKEYNKEIDNAEARVKKENYLTHEKVTSLLKEWENE